MPGIQFWSFSENFEYFQIYVIYVKTAQGVQYTDKLCNIIVLIYTWCWIGLCVGVNKKCYGQWNCCISFLSYLEWTNN
jgi:hypothetical protein